MSYWCKFVEKNNSFCAVIVANDWFTIYFTNCVPYKCKILFCTLMLLAFLYQLGHFRVVWWCNRAVLLGGGLCLHDQSDSVWFGDGLRLYDESDHVWFQADCDGNWLSCLRNVSCSCNAIYIQT